MSRESGTVSGTLPTTVASQTGRLGKIVYWVQQAWLDIQNSRSAWRWMEGEWSGSLTASTARYTSSSFSLSRFSEWIVDTKPGDQVTSIYLTATGVSDENGLDTISFRDWRRLYDRGSQTNNRPFEYAVSPANELCFGPIPNATYTAQGLYRKGPQSLSADADTPELPTRFHDLIAWKALILLAEHDEGEIALATALRKHREMMSDLERDQLPTVTTAGALA